MMSTNCGSSGDANGERGHRLAAAAAATHGTQIVVDERTARRLKPAGPLGQELAVALIEAGFVLHDCDGPLLARALGGVCVTPTSLGAYPRDGVIVAWTVHDRLGTAEDRDASYQAVLETMNATLADVLVDLDFTVEPFGQAGVNLVTGRAARRGAGPPRWLGAVPQRDPQED